MIAAGAVTQHKHWKQTARGKALWQTLGNTGQSKDLPGTLTPNPSSTQSSVLLSPHISARSHLRQLPRTGNDEHLRADRAGSAHFGMVMLTQEWKQIPSVGSIPARVLTPNAPTTVLHGIYLHQQHQPAKKPPCQSHQKSTKAQCAQNHRIQSSSI